MSVERAEKTELGHEVELSATEAFIQDNTDINTLDLLEQLEMAGFETAQCAFTKAAMTASGACLDKLRKEDWAFICLSKEEFQTFAVQLPVFKHALSDYLATFNLQTKWVRQQHAKQVTYWLSLASRGNEESAVIEPFKQRAPKIIEEVDSKAPVDGTFEELWTYHQKRARKVAIALLGKRSDTRVNADDILQELAIGLQEVYDKRGAEAFRGSMMTAVGQHKLVDMLRRINPGSRMRVQVRKVIEQQCNTGYTKAESVAAVFERYPRADKVTVQRLADAVFEGGTYYDELSFEELFVENDQDVAEEHARMQPETAEQAGVLISEFLQEYLTSNSWHPEKQQKMRRIAKAYFIDQRTLKSIATDEGVTESRICQLMQNDILPAIRYNLERSNVDAAFAAELLAIA